ncbi:hypothetical protein [Kitasatospora sp. NPDC057198]|uniref:hypothetical protein n=1 Tax=Kitasatospora sp. NPDC057198 TaxID=3346046 RepID=UPI00363EBCB8
MNPAPAVPSPGAVPRPTDQRATAAEPAGLRSVARPFVSPYRADPAEGVALPAPIALPEAGRAGLPVRLLQPAGAVRRSAGAGERGRG